MKKFLLDMILLVLFILVMSFHFIPRILHEILGLVMFAAFLLHLAWNFGWIKNIRRGSWPRRRIFSTLINFLLLATFTIIFVTGVCMSNYLFKDFIPPEINRNMTLHQHHVALPYLFLILLGAHLSLNRQILLGRLPKMKKNFARIVLIIFAAAGIYGSFMNRIGDRLLMKHIFATPATELNFGTFIFLLLGVMILYALITFSLEKIFLQPPRKKNSTE